MPNPTGSSSALAPKTVLDEASGISETTLGNGLRLLVKPQPENPVCACMIWYAVGARDEDVGETGLSHYLEHMQFKGTDKYPKGAIDKVTQKNGGSNNASTRNDCTEYHFTFPADRWPAALEIEANRMRNSDVQQTEFDPEKNVVLQELKKDLDDPEDVLNEAVNSASFRVCGYHHPVIGWPEDVETTTRERMKRYYLKHYTPDRATIVIVGGVDRDAVIADVVAKFSSIPRGDVVRHELAEPPPLGETRLTIRMGEVPRLLMAFRSVSISDPKEPWLDLVSSILAGDKTTRLEKRLVDTAIAASASCWSDTRRDDGLFEIQVEPTEGHTLEECEAAVKEVLAEFVAKGPTAEEIARARAKIMAGQVFQQESSMGLGERLGSLAVVTDWRYHLRYPQVLASATADNLRDISKQVFDPTKAVVGRSVPADEGGADKGDAAKPTGAGGGGAPHRSDALGWIKGARGAARRGESDGGAASAIERALDLKPTRVVLDNGLTVILLRRTNAPVFFASLAVRDGRLGEATPGLDTFVGSLFAEGTTAHTGEEIAAAIGAVGGSLSSAGAGVSSKTLSKDAGLALQLIAEVLTKPAFAADAIERIRGQQLQAIEQELDTPRAVADAKFRAAVYGSAHPLGHSANGNAESVKAITREQVVAHHARFFVPKNATLTIVSDQSPDAILPLVKEALGSWAGGEKPTLNLPAIPTPAARSIHARVSKKQTNLFLGHVGVVRSDPDYVALEVMDNVFGTGAGFTDRLSQNVRDQKGLAYTVFGNITSNSGIVPGSLRVYAGTNPEDAARALTEMRKEVQGILDRPPTPEELAGAKAALRGGMVTRLETASDVATVLDLCERYGLGFDYPKRYLEALEKVTSEDVVRVGKSHIHPDALVEVVVGPNEQPDATPGK
jgi:zinc protease